MSTSVLATVPWWRSLLERLGRQAAGTAVPILAAVVAAGGDVSVETVAFGLAGTLAISLGKAALLAVADVQATTATALGWQLVDRAVPAAAGVLAGLWPVDAAGLADIDVRAALVAAGAAALLAVIGYWVTPPALTAGRVGAVRRSDVGGAHLRMMIAVAVVLGLAAVMVLFTGDAGAAVVKHRARPGTVKTKVVGVPHVEARTVTQCRGRLAVAYSTEIPFLPKDASTDLKDVTEDARYLFQGETTTAWAWTFLKPDGSALVELHHVGNGAPGGGTWDPVDRARVLHHSSEYLIDVGGEPTFDLVRVTVQVAGIGRVASSGVVPDGCVA